MQEPSDSRREPTPARLSVTWDQLPTELVRPGVRRCAVGTEDVMLVMNTIEPAMQPMPHSHPFPQVAYIVSGHATYTVDGTAHLVGPGSVLVIPPGVEHHIEPLGDEPVLNLDVFAPPRDDYAHLVRWMGPDAVDSPGGSA